MRRKKKLTAYELWKELNKKNISREEYKALLIKSHIIIPKRHKKGIHEFKMGCFYNPRGIVYLKK